MEGFGLSLQAPKLLLDEVSQSLPHLQLTLVFSSEGINEIFHTERFPHEDGDSLSSPRNVGRHIWQNVAQTNVPQRQDDGIQGAFCYQPTHTPLQPQELLSHVDFTFWEDVHPLSFV